MILKIFTNLHDSMHEPCSSNLELRGTLVQTVQTISQFREVYYFPSNAVWACCNLAVASSKGPPQDKATADNLPIASISNSSTGMRGMEKENEGSWHDI